METILTHAQTIVHALLNLMPTSYQKDGLQALFGLFFQADGRPLPQYSTIKSRGFRVWRGKGSRTPVQLALRLLDSLPSSLPRSFRVMILADTAFGRVRFLKGVRQRRHAAIVGVRGADCLYFGALGLSVHQPLNPT